MDFQTVVRRRHMVREFTDEPVSEESLTRLLRNAQHCPSAGFSQGQAYLVLRGADIELFWRTLLDQDAMSTYDSVRSAPLLIIPMSSKDAYLDRYARPDKGWTDRDEARWPVPFWHIDTGMATLLMLLTAVDEDLGALYFGIPPEAVDPVRAAFGIPADHEPIGAVAVGHSAETEIRNLKSRRRSLDDQVHYGRW